MKNFYQQIAGSEFRISRMNETAPVQTIIDCPENLDAYIRPLLAESLIYKPDVENLIVVHLNTRRNPIGFEVISNGTLDTLLVHPREVFKSAIIANSSAIILVHNHPSGDCTPSDADIKVTRDLIRAGQLMKIEVADHIILGRGNPPGMAEKRSYSSLRELNYFYN
jgi:DNA repair protein RadC